MSSLLETKDYIKKIYVKNEVYLAPLLKFILAAVIFVLINAKMGYMERLDKFVVVLVAALFCSFMPLQITAVASAAFMLLHYYALAPECALVAVVLFLLMFLLYIRFVPKEAIIILITPICFFLKIPYVIPVAVGLLGTPVSAISVSMGVIISYLVEYTEMNATTISAMDTETAVTKLRFLIDGLVGNKAMLVTMVAFIITLFVVYLLRRRSMDHAWTIAIIAGTLTDVLILLVGDFFFDLNYSILGILLGTVVAGAVCRFLEFFTFYMDYNRTENVQFEDDEYYYYVKAVPKITVTTPDKKVKKINIQRAGTSKNTGIPSTVKTAHGVSGKSGQTRTKANGDRIQK